MNKNEIYVSILLISLILISVFWKTELEYRRSQFSNNIVIPEPFDEDDNYNYSDWSKPKVKKNKPSGKGWMDSYSDGIIFNYNPRWNPEDE